MTFLTTGERPVQQRGTTQQHGATQHGNQHLSARQYSNVPPGQHVRGAATDLTQQRAMEERARQSGTPTHMDAHQQRIHVDPNARTHSPLPPAKQAYKGNPRDFDPRYDSDCFLT